jgi:hypothetical protein
VAFVKVLFVPVRFVTVANCAYRFVDVVFVPVAFTQTRFAGVKFVTDKFEKLALFANRLVVVTLEDVTFCNTAFVPARLVKVPVVAVMLFPVAVLNPKAPVAVAFVKTPVDGVMDPIVVPLIEPPLITTFGDTMVARLPCNAFNVVPLAVENPNHPVDVPFVKERAVMVP